MARYVTQTGKDRDGDITALCNSAESWSPRYKADAIRDIENKTQSYKVRWNDGIETDIHVVNDPQKGKYLRTDKDSTTRNNLDDLPDCNC
jgi:hypothetical protein